jgi:hypothetical protein
VNSESVRFSYTIFYYPSSDEDCNRKMNFLYEQLEHVLLTYKSKGRIVTEDGSYFYGSLLRTFRDPNLPLNYPNAIIRGA